jgi:hypothetical protein
MTGAGTGTPASAGSIDAMIMASMGAMKYSLLVNIPTHIDFSYHHQNLQDLKMVLA